ncbi:MAG: SAM-dependent methyltransferase [Opitutaceae bacterium]|jgi:SAM-dependent methyltransferase|nr:SAM-dependent methyltransferase [Opitutaceae bacterium]
MSNTANDPLSRFRTLLHAAVTQGTLVKLTCGKPFTDTVADPTLKNLFVRPVNLKAGPRLSFVWRHATRDITKNHPPTEALAELDALLGATFGDAHLFTPEQSIQFQTLPNGRRKLTLKTAAEAPPPPRDSHDRHKAHAIPADAPWLRALGVTNDCGQPREGMAGKFRQIQKFSELLTHLLAEAGLVAPRAANEEWRMQNAESPDATAVSPAIPPCVSPGATGSATVSLLHSSFSISPAGSVLRIADMGCGKGYLTFALAALLGPRAAIAGIERRADLVALANRIAAQHGFAPAPDPAPSSPHSSSSQDVPVPVPAPGLVFREGEISAAASAAAPTLDVLIALHACNTATDDALAAGIAADARLLVVSPCCHKELRPQLTPPSVLAGALAHGILHERESEIVTDALRAELLEWAGYRTKVFEFISPEHTAKNLMIAAIRTRAPGSPQIAGRIRALAQFYGIREQRLARHLGFALTEPEQA